MFASTLRTLRRSTALTRGSLKATTSTTRSVHTPSIAQFHNYSGSKQQLHQRLSYAAAAVLAGGAALSYFSTQAFAAPTDDPNVGVLSDKDFHPFELIGREKYNHDSSIYHFRLNGGAVKADLPVSFCLVAKIEGEDGKPIIRPYTPIETRDKSDVLTFLVKTYPEGKLSRHFDSLQAGESLLFKGPIKKLQYEANLKKHVSFVAGGSGITPCLQIMDKIFGNPEDKTSVTLLFANRTPADILLKERVDAYKNQFNNRLDVIYFVDKEQQGWSGEVGLINKDKLQKYIPSPSNDSLVYVCGPPKMYESISGTKAPDFSQGEVGGALKELGYTKDQVYKL